MAGLDSQIASLRRQAKQAERYKALSDQIRVAEARLLFARWRDAAAAAETARSEAKAADERVTTAQAATADIQIGDQRATRLEPRQGDGLDLRHLGIAHQQEVAMPAMRGAGDVDRDKGHSGGGMQLVKVQKPRAVAKPIVSLLQGHDIRRDLGNHGGGAGQIAAAVGPHPFVDVP